MTDDLHPIQRLAHRCGSAGLNLRQSRALFEAMYRADALVLASGCVTKAAENSGISRGGLSRLINRRDDTCPPCNHDCNQGRDCPARKGK